MINIGNAAPTFTSNLDAALVPLIDQIVTVRFADVASANSPFAGAADLRHRAARNIRADVRTTGIRFRLLVMIVLPTATGLGYTFTPLEDFQVMESV